MEYALFLDDIKKYKGKNIQEYTIDFGEKNIEIETVNQKLKEIGDADIEYLYYGSEFCENLLPDWDSILEILKLCDKEKLELRLETSLQAAGEKPILCFLHYPPLYQGYECPEILQVLDKYRVQQCCYGHLHGPTIRRRMEGKRGETEFSLISADYLGFIPKKICD